MTTFWIGKIPSGNRLRALTIVFLGNLKRIVGVLLDVLRRLLGMVASGKLNSISWKLGFSETSPCPNFQNSLTIHSKILSFVSIGVVNDNPLHFRLFAFVVLLFTVCIEIVFGRKCGIAICTLDFFHSFVMFFHVPSQIRQLRTEKNLAMITLKLKLQDRNYAQTV